MNVIEFREYCLSLHGATEKMPFINMKTPSSRNVLCFYVGSKWFCFVDIEEFERCCVKMLPDVAIELREQYEGIRPAWHMNKRMWSDVYFDSDVPDDMIRQIVATSHDLVAASLTKAEKTALQIG